MSDESISGRVQAIQGTARALSGQARLVEVLAEFRALDQKLAKLPAPHSGPLEACHRAIASLDDDVHECLAGAREILASVADDSHCRTLLHAGRDTLGSLLDHVERCLQAYEKGSHGVPERPILADLRWRLARTAADRVIWGCCSSGPPHPRLWRWLGMAFVHAPDARDLSGAVSEKTGTRARHSVEFHYVRAIAACTASLDLLAPRLLGSVDGLLHLATPVLRLEPDRFDGATHFVDPLGDEAPHRIAGVTENVPGRWFFTPLAASAVLNEYRHAPAGSAPTAWSDAQDASLQALAVEHLLRHWSDIPPIRRHRRHLLDGKLTAVAGIEALKRVFAGELPERREEWQLRDASRSGIGVITANRSIRIGQLIGVHLVDGKGWQLGLVRRTWAQGGDTNVVGLELLSSKPVVARVDDGRCPAEVLLCDPLLRGEAVRVVVPSRTLGAPSVPLFVTRNGSVQKLKPLDASYVGEGFELRVYQVL
ncbi:hypothetical protein [Azoarcus sp. DN11]|uniref:hypothetical protein n=1 Tax=Azoarcus sp. DN11 TaxID=356837 RepID=UPI000EB09CFD|nr:hypothetical protein [Azoarcus sp. DN11]AYH42525.1 hypothetical protein CDA09_03835 [Azoarcus sp. DN11]